MESLQPEGSISYKYTDDKDIEIVFIGSIKFELTEHLYNLCKEIDKPIDNCIIDLANVDNIDSSGLGMLLILREQQQLKHATINLYTADNAYVLKKLKSHHFNKIFDIN